MVSRPLLAARLDDASSFPVTLVCATAGAGKTTLLAEWARELDLPWGWLTLDDDDRSLDVLLTNLILALQSAAPELGESALSRLRLEPEPDLDALVAELDDDLLGLEQDVVLVLDDAHAIADPHTIEFFRKFLKHPPPRLHLVLSARRDPPLPLGRLRGRGQLLELRAADLAFSEAETGALLRNAGVSPELAASLDQRNEGWAAGIHLGALALRGQAAGTRGVDEIVAAGVHDLIVSDILPLQPEPLQRLLLVSSLVERFTAGLCAELLSDASLAVRPLLQGLAAEGLLLFSLGGEPEWFRYHQIFRQVLYRELQQRTDPDDLAELHARASAWFERAGFISDALTHALDAGTHADPVTLVERHAQRAIAEDNWPELARWLDRLPPAVVRSRPELSIAQAWVHQSRGEYADLISALDRATVLVDAGTDQHGEGWAIARRAELEVIRAFISPVAQEAERYRQAGALILEHGADRFASSFGVYELGFGLWYLGETERFRTQMQAVVDADRGLDDPFARQREMWARLLLGFELFLSGDLARTRDNLERILGLASSYEFRRFVAQTHYVLGWLEYEADRIDSAIEHLERVLRERATGIIILVSATLALARAFDSAGRSAEADTLLLRLGERYRAMQQLTYGRAAFAALEAERALRRGDLDACNRWVSSAPELRTSVEIASNESPLLTYARVLIATGRLAEADANLQTLERIAAAPPRMISFQIRVASVRALHTWLTGDRQRAIDQLLAACDLATAGGYVRSLLDTGVGAPAFFDLLRQLPADRVPLPVRALEWTAPPVHTRAVVYEIAPYEQLTEREQDVADGLMRRLSYKEIALELDISPLTVKSHSTHIYSKLGVSSRRQMIRLLEQDVSS